MSKYYIASCVFTTQFPELSFKIQDYVRKTSVLWLDAVYLIIS